MLLKSPPNLHYPITVTELLRSPNDEVSRAAPLFSYYYTSTVLEADRLRNWKEVERAFPTRFESETDGKLVRWQIQPGDVIKGANIALVEIEEPCRHDVQFGGMCAQCGKDLTKVDYNTIRPETSRADTSIVPAHTALRISSDEAAKLDKDAKLRLLGQRKLSLVVDLDLTIIQATVDSTIGDWQNDENNPNHEAVRDVRSFTLRDDFQGQRGPDVAYYVKMRPGLKRFLAEMAKLYELHIYTMGTRAYAENIAKIVDPDQTLFGDRILSRTETPGEVSKNLRKLFPVDSKMVVIIDDRADVWRYSDYLVPVVPYNFFVGIGDINSSFLPRREDMIAKLNQEAASVGSETAEPRSLADNVEQGGTGTDSAPILEDGTSKAGTSTLETLVEIRGGKDATAIQQQTARQDEALAAQLKERPLLQKQKELDNLEDDLNTDEANIHDGHRNARQPLLQDNDTELQRIGRELSLIHRQFYAQYDRNLEAAAATFSTSSGRIAQLKGHDSVTVEPGEDLAHVPDVKDIIEPHRTNTLRGTVIAFSGVVYTHIPAELSAIGKIAKRLGATVGSDITPATTHLVTRYGEPTSKIRRAMRRPDINIVSTDWIFESSVCWTRLDEDRYRIDFGEILPPGERGEEDPDSEGEEGNGEGRQGGILGKLQDEGVEEEDEVSIEDLDVDFDTAFAELDESDLASDTASESSSAEVAKRQRSEGDQPGSDDIVPQHKRRRKAAPVKKGERTDFDGSGIGRRQEIDTSSEEDEFALLEAQLAAASDEDASEDD